MKKNIFLFVFTALLSGASIFNACQKEKVAEQPSAATEQESSGDRAACNAVIVGNGVGLVLCGVAAGAGCSVCTVTAFSVAVTANPQVFNLTTNEFSLTNPTGAPIQAAVFFGDCAWQAPALANIAPGATVRFRTATNANGCCIIIPC